ncbi:hypothetical protein [Aquimarina sp. 2201CG14-23]|uniref:hypothetical protein n=1 Tax=Aquimarina mycalae TaxID=3040073 RepID=UPI002478108C|nr:hypothetical protein [Aquimarina sp. 2201CG14-23]MDH7448038.1 hypothetical protein [Aquimarina sp. 2201CG14-23]
MKKLFRFLFQTIIVFLIVMLLFELSYRFSIIDFYKAEFTYLNDTDSIKSKHVDYLVFGDSFSVAENNYINVLRKSSNKSFINSGVSGTGIKQVNTFLNRRLEKYTPKNIIYQVYVGNDLADVDHLTNYNKLPLIRNLYWDISDVFISSLYINAKLGQFKQRKMETDSNSIKESFATDSYNTRSKLYLMSDSSYLYKSITITEGFEKRYSIWIKEVREFIEELSKESRVYIVFIPHCTQVNSFYFNNFKKMGATFLNEDEFNKIEYGFFEKASLDLKAYKNVSLINPLEIFNKSDSLDHRLYYMNDPHLNDMGQKVLGDYLKEQLSLNK